MSKKSQEITVINLDDIKGDKIVNVSEWKKKQEKIVKDNPYIEITDNSTYVQAKANRTALLKGKTNLLGINGQEGIIKKHFKNVVSKSSEILQGLANITIPKYELQQEEVKRYEQVKADEKAEKERLNQERIENIKNLIESKYNDWISEIKNYTLNHFQESGNIIEMLSDIETDQFEELDSLWNEKTRLIVAFFTETKSNLQIKEDQRIENERLEAERKKLEDEKKVEDEKRRIESEKLAKEKAEFEAEKEKTREIERKKQAKIDAENKIKQDELDKQEAEVLAEKKRLEDIEQERLLREQKEVEKQEALKQKKLAEKQEKARLKRIESLKPEKEQLLNYINSISLPENTLKLKDDVCKNFYSEIESDFKLFKSNLIEKLNEIN